MVRFRAVFASSCALVLLALTVRPAPACRLDFDFRPATNDLQIVVWIETAGGEFVRTVFMTDKTGRYGLGNRPGRFDFNSEWAWPYGRRTTTFPVWASKSDRTYPKLIFQDQDDDDLSHGINQSSVEPFPPYCRPLRESEADAMTCATVAYTDKGMFHPTERTKYPPRNDMSVFMDGVDHEDMPMFADMNDLDAISQPTPPGNADFTARTVLDLADGDYVAYIEVSREFDQNQYYDYPSPVGIPWSEYGRAYRGQPSTIWRAPFTVNEGGGTFGAIEYAGYGDGTADMGGGLAPPDSTITTQTARAFAQATGDTVVASSRQWTFANGGFTAADRGRTLTVSGAAAAALNDTYTIDTVVSATRVTTIEPPATDETFGAGVNAEVCCAEGSGALRLLLVDDPAADYRFRVRVPARGDRDLIPPAAPAEIVTVAVTPTTARFEFDEPGDDGNDGMVSVYEVRYLAGSPLSETNFYSSGIALPSPLSPVSAGNTLQIVLLDLQPETHYWVGVRAADECLNPSELLVFEFVTPAAERPPVDGCTCRAGASRAAGAWSLGAVALALACPLLVLRRRRARRPER